MGTAIEWTDRTANPFRAVNNRTGQRGHYCEKVSNGCCACYASQWQYRMGTRLDFVPRNHQRIAIELDKKVLERVAKLKKPRRIFSSIRQRPSRENGSSP